jgi:RNA polymerase-binding transcription factor DksA
MSSADSSRPDADERRAHDHAARLRDELERAIQHADTAQAELDEALADPGVIQEDRDAAARLLEHARGQLESVRTAMAHLEAGTYGRCETCGGDIGEERLAALVNVTTCVNCAG